MRFNGKLTEQRSQALHVHLVSFVGYIVPCADANAGLIGYNNDYTGDCLSQCEDAILYAFSIFYNETGLMKE